ncbi:MAG: hypothetical protein P0S95_06055 [Rhabdochlamydiaceae bacterium]|nr:hypothetical protein [Candidatus Amphrikana amoebophyrae]
MATAVDMTGVVAIATTTVDPKEENPSLAYGIAKNVLMGAHEPSETKSLKRSTEIPSIFSRMSAKDQNKLAELIASKMSITDAMLAKKCVAIRSGDLSNEVFKEDDWLIFAFMGYNKNLISASELSVASHIDQWMAEHPSRLDAIGSLDDETIRKSYFSSVREDVSHLSFSHLSGIEKLVIFDKIDSAKMGREYDAFVFCSYKYTPFHIKINDQSSQSDIYVIASPAVIQLTLKAIDPKDYVTLFPTFGFSNKMKDFIGIPHLRTLGLSCRYFLQPNIIHGRKASSLYSIYFHDVSFHAYTTSFDPYREVEDNIADVLWNCSNGKENIETVVHFADRPLIYFIARAIPVVKIKFPEVVFWQRVLDFLSEEQLTYWLKNCGDIKLPPIDRLDKFAKTNPSQWGRKVACIQTLVTAKTSA